MSAPWRLVQLRPGMQCRVVEGGPVWTVYRVTQGAAYLSRSLAPELVTVPVKRRVVLPDGRVRMEAVLDAQGRPEVRTFQAAQGDTLPGIAPRSGVWLVKEEGEA